MYTLTFDVYRNGEYLSHFQYDFDDTFTYDGAVHESFIICKAYTIRPGTHIANISLESFEPVS